MKAVLFDLDGTLVDTAPDLGHALNVQRARHGYSPLDDDCIRPVASHGTHGMLALGFGISPQDACFEAMCDEYLALYQQSFTRSPRLFAGFEAVLSCLETQGLRWGVVTNKPRRFTQPLMASMGLLARAAVVVSGDDAPHPKPAPDTLLLACQQLAIAPEQCLYVGDAERDIVAGRAAGMKTLVALFGYLDEHDTPQAWGADGMIKRPEALLDHL